MSLKARIADAVLRVPPEGSAEVTHVAPEDGFAVVPAASRMVELMELAAARLMRPHLGAGQTSVSISLDMTHAAKVAVNGPVRAVATYRGVSGRMHRFAIHVFDESGLIGSADHTRAVVIGKRLTALARKRAGQASPLLNV